MDLRSRSALLALTLLLAACAQEGARTAATAAPAASPIAAAERPSPATPASAAPEARVAAANPEELGAELPGFPLDQLPPYQRTELVTAARDEFCYCGCPHTIAGCLKDHPQCKHSLRAATLLAGELAAGATRTEALATYTRYYDSFKGPKRQTIDLTATACKGPADAAITLVEYFDFECPHCAVVGPILEQLVASRKDVRLCAKHYPLPGHQNAYSAAQAAEFARTKGKFFELYRLQLANQRKLSPDKIKQLVAEVGLSPAELVKAIQGDAVTAAVEKSKEEGKALGIEGTPTLFVNGRKLELPINPELLNFTLEDELEWQTNGGKWTAD